MTMRRWLLPEYIDDILPAEAQRIERLRRAILDLFRVHGYALVMPPLLEYLESLLTGTGHDLDLKTFKLVDQLSGRMLGVRADITPQVARIDAHLLNRAGIARLCYTGSVLHALPSGMGTREPLQIGAELYGHAGVESDIEIQALMVAALRCAGVNELRVDLGHVAVFRALMLRFDVAPEREAELFQVLQTKDLPALRELVHGLDRQLAQALLLLPELYGGAEALATARSRLPDYPDIVAALEQLQAIAAALRDLGQEVHCFDLAELRGYHYHTGAVFAAYSGGRSNALALGGRYDEVGRAFGRARPATGFTMDLRELAAIGPPAPPRHGILAPYRPADGALRREIQALRARGEVVIVDLPGHEQTRGELECDRELVLEQGDWRIAPALPQQAGST
jgi:ATP phosphoribosyltransferase regulatory subunit